MYQFVFRFSSRAISCYFIDIITKSFYFLLRIRRLLSPRYSGCSELHCFFRSRICGSIYLRDAASRSVSMASRRKFQCCITPVCAYTSSQSSRGLTAFLSFAAHRVTVHCPRAQLLNLIIRFHDSTSRVAICYMYMQFTCQNQRIDIIEIASDKMCKVTNLTVYSDKLRRMQLL